MTTYEQIIEALQGKCVHCKGRGYKMERSKVRTCFGSTSLLEPPTTEDYISKCQHCEGTGRRS